jgi:diguanylate cyclase (GGDEF)-like protein
MVSRAKRIVATGVCAMAVLAIGWLDYATGPEIGLSLLYLIPIAATAWLGGVTGAVIVATLAAAAWLGADVMFRDNVAISLWNSFTRLVIYVSEGIFIALLRRDREKLRALAARESQLARTDEATSLPNMRAFLEACRAELARAAETGESIALIYIDLDNFKRFNDTLGHAAGDDILEEVARVLRSAAENHVAARLGGDEFAVLLRGGATVAYAERVASAITARIRDIARLYADVGFGATAGVVVFTEPPESGDELIRAADDAMYAGKASGKGRVVVQNR